MNNVLQGGVITLKCKDLRIISLQITSPQEFINVANSIEQLSHLSSPQYLYPYFYRPMYTILEDGYTMFRNELEYAKLLATDEWRITHVNADFSVCATYGASLVVPKTITDDEIVQSANFRDGGRFPVLSYKHDNGVCVTETPIFIIIIIIYNLIFRSCQCHIFMIICFLYHLGCANEIVSTDWWARLETLPCR